MRDARAISTSYLPKWNYNTFGPRLLITFWRSLKLVMYKCPLLLLGTYVIVDGRLLCRETSRFITGHGGTWGENPLRTELIMDFLFHLDTSVPVNVATMRNCEMWGMTRMIPGLMFIILSFGLCIWFLPLPLDALTNRGVCVPSAISVWLGVPIQCSNSFWFAQPFNVHSSQYFWYS